jgi:catalase
MYYPSGDGQASTARPSSLVNSAKVNDLEKVTVRVPLDGDHHVTPFAQARVDDLDTSLRAGSRGPATLEDPVARKKIFHGESGFFASLASR